MKNLEQAWLDHAEKEGISKDKRTKEYKAFKETFNESGIEIHTEPIESPLESPSEGLGDTIAKITKATGIKKIVEFFNDGEPCESCEERQQKLNNLYRYSKPKELTEEEYYILDSYFSQGKNSVSDSEQRSLIAVYNRVLSAKKTFSRCKPCVRGMVSQLKKIYEVYSA